MKYNGMKDLRDSFIEVQQQHEKFIRKFLTEMGMRAMAQTVKLTPVDSGLLRESWELSDVFRKGDELYIVIFNPVLYASFVEEGHMQHRRWVPGIWEDNGTFTYIEGYKGEGMMLNEMWIQGKHMARISVNKIEKELPARYDKAFKEFMKGLGAG